VSCINRDVNCSHSEAAVIANVLVLLEYFSASDDADRARVVQKARTKSYRF